MAPVGKMAIYSEIMKSACMFYFDVEEDVNDLLR